MTLLAEHSPEGSAHNTGIAAHIWHLIAFSLQHFIEEGETTESLILRARYAFVKGDNEQALALMESAKEAAGEDWSESSEEVLAGYRTD